MMLTALPVRDSLSGLRTLGKFQCYAIATNGLMAEIFCDRATPAFGPALCLPSATVTLTSLVSLA